MGFNDFFDEPQFDFDKEKQKFIDLAIRDKERYEREMKQFEEEGFFVNEDGVKSTDLMPELKDFPADTVMPKKFCNAVAFFTKENFKKIQESMDKEESKNGANVMKQVKLAYDNLSENDK